MFRHCFMGSVIKTLVSLKPPCCPLYSIKTDLSQNTQHRNKKKNFPNKNCPVTKRTDQCAVHVSDMQLEGNMIILTCLPGSLLRAPHSSRSEIQYSKTDDANRIEDQSRERHVRSSCCCVTGALGATGR